MADQSDASSPSAAAATGAASAASHTPGPWRWQVTSDGWDGESICLIGGDNVLILSGWGYDAYGISVGQEGPQTDAATATQLPDTRLIAAAPDLLAACKLALDACERNHAIDWGVLETAINKAIGG